MELGARHGEHHGFRLGPVTVLVLTSHPFQRAGAWTVACLAGRDHPDRVTEADLDAAVERIVADEVMAAVVDKGAAGYGWWKVMFNFFPNSATTHATRAHDPDVLARSMRALFEPDDTASETWPCVYCGQQAGAVWGKTGLQLVASERLLNTTPPGVAGWPVCRPCRVAARALPYGSALAPAVATVLAASDEEVERAFVADCWRANRSMLAAGAQDVPGRSESPEAAVVRVVRSLPRARGDGTLWTFKNANDPAQAVLRVDHLRGGTPSFLVRLGADPLAEAGWRAMERALTVPRRDGTVIRGSDAVARLLFHRETTEGRWRADLVQKASSIARSGSVAGPDLALFGALVRRYVKEVLALTEDVLGRVEEVADAVASYIKTASSRGRFQVFRRADRPWSLARYLREVEADRILSGGGPARITASSWNLLSGSDARAQTARDLLFFAVCERLPEGFSQGEEEEEDQGLAATVLAGAGTPEEEFA